MASFSWKNRKTDLRRGMASVGYQPVSKKTVNENPKSSRVAQRVLIAWFVWVLASRWEQ